MKNTISSARKTHFVETLSGRRRYFKAKDASGEGLAHIDRQAVNSVIQGSAADLLKCAMILLWKPLSELDSEIILQIHDELVIDCPDSDEVCEKVIALMKQVMCVESKKMLQDICKANHPEVQYDFDVLLEQSVNIGKNMAFKE